jgi:hypothetical protein
MLKKPAFRRLFLPLALLITAFSITASAQAWTLHEVNYGPYALHPSTRIAAPGAPWATHPSDITGNIAIYEGAGTVSVCQSTFDMTSWVSREGCGNNAVGNALNLTPYYGHQLEPGIKNNSPWQHNIRGVWYWGNP